MDAIDAAISAALVLFGFFLSVGWQRFTDWRSYKTERKRLLTMLRLETDQNSVQCQSLSNAIGTMNAQGNHGVLPLEELATSGWAFALAKWDLLNLNADDSRLLAQTYQGTRQLNESFRLRSQFSMLMVALSNYMLILGRLDQALVEGLNNYLALTRKLRPRLALLIDASSGEASGT